MSKIFSEDAYCLGLLYAYIYSGRNMVLFEDLDKFYKTVEKNLIEVEARDLYSAIGYDDDFQIYFSATGKNDELYYILYPDLDLKRAREKYIGCLTTEILIASQKENALNCLDLKKENGNIMKINYNVESSFVRKLK